MDSCKRLNGGDKDMKALVDLIHRHGLKAGAWQNPGV